MKINVTETLMINLETEVWVCSRCGHVHGSARANYKEGLLVYNRNPGEIHRPLLDTKRYDYSFAPDPRWCTILEYYCPECGVMVEVEYTVPGHPPLHDIEFDIDALKSQWKDRPVPKERVFAEPAKRVPHGRADPSRLLNSKRYRGQYRNAK
jgi:acetone carboxylase gamma subunit